MIFLYENSKGEKLNLLKKPYRAYEADVFDSSWEVSSDGYEKTIEIDVVDDKSNFSGNMNRLYDVFAVDSDNDKDGKLWINNTYLRCHVIRSEKSNWKGSLISTVLLTFIAKDLTWIKESVESFWAYGTKARRISDEGFDFNYDFDHDYTAPEQGRNNITVSATCPVDFSAIIYGQAYYPEFAINGYRYKILDTLDDGEYIIIDSVSKSITKYTSDGKSENILNKRDTSQSIFAKINPGTNLVTWDGTFGFDIVFYIARKEPLWM